MKRRIILWDNDIGWCERLRRELEKEEIVTEEVEDRADLWRKLTECREDVRFYQSQGREPYFSLNRDEILAIVLSEEQLMEELPDEWQEELRKICNSGIAPVLFVGEQEDEEQEFLVFSMGVSDYFSREKALRICVARIFASVGKGYWWRANDKIEWEIMLDKKRCQFYYKKLSFALTPKEYMVLACLLAGGGEVVTRRELLLAAWEKDALECDRVLDTVIKQLRNKLKSTEYIICSKYGVGYAIKRKLS